MSKLKAIKDRSVATNVQGDLRGLGNEDFFVNSFPFSVLSATNITPEGLVPIIQKYNLKIHEESSANLTHLCTSNVQPGEHKLQAVVLFTAGIDLLQTNPQSMLHLAEISQLHLQMDKALRGTPTSAFSIDGVVKLWMAKPQTFSLEASVTHYLYQAGFPLAPSNDMRHLNPLEITQVHATLSQSAQLKKSIRKVG
jgi:hypothetical protein